jgi:hypothetical protein
MGDVLRDEEDVDCAQIEVVEVGHSRHAFTASVHASIELEQSVRKGALSIDGEMRVP